MHLALASDLDISGRSRDGEAAKKGEAPGKWPTKLPCLDYRGLLYRHFGLPKALKQHSGKIVVLTLFNGLYLYFHLEHVHLTPPLVLAFGVHQGKFTIYKIFCAKPFLSVTGWKSLVTVVNLSQLSICGKPRDGGQIKGKKLFESLAMHLLFPLSKLFDVIHPIHSSFCVSGKHPRTNVQLPIESILPCDEE